MSDRGSILISTANDIGEALVEKLGGEGYAPSVWDKEYNKLGIAEADSAPALSVLEDSSETGTARGSILMSTANAIGAMLNKKYNTDRGFKPKEWASAVSMLSPLPEKTASSAPICEIDDGADDVPTKSLVVTIPPTLSGVSTVSVVATGKNLLNPSELVVGSINSSGKNINSSTRVRSGYIKINGGQKYSMSIGGSVQIFEIHQYKADFTKAVNLISVDAQSYVLTASNDTAFIRLLMRFSNNATIAVSDITELQLQTGDTVTAYEAYTAINYTASLGRTIYGGQVDIVNGTGQDTTLRYELDENDSWSAYSGASHSFWHNVSTGEDRPIKQTESSASICNYATYSSASPSSAPDFSFLIQGGQRIVVTADSTIDTLDKFKTWLSSHNLVFVCPASTPTDFTFTGQEVPTRLGYNAFWSDSGDTAVEYYGEPEPYTRGTASGAIANVQSARTDLPFTMAKANIAPNFAGVDTVEVTKAGKNLFNKVNPNEVDGYITTTGFSTSNTSAKTIYIPIVAGATYTVSKTAGQRFSLATAEVIPSNNAVFTNRQANNTATSISITAGANDKYLWAWIYLDGTDTGTLDDMLSSVQIEVGSTATAYTPYEEPTVYTADLGEPVYGGYAEIVNGVGSAAYSLPTLLSSLAWSKTTISGHEAFCSNLPDGYIGQGSGVVGGDCDSYDITADANLGTDKTIRFYYNASFNISRCVIRDDQYASLTGAQFKEIVSGNIIYELAESSRTELNFDGQVISPSEGVNNLWNNAGGDTDVEYFEQE